MAESSDTAGLYIFGGMIAGAVVVFALHGVPEYFVAPDTCVENCDDLSAQRSMAIAAWAMFAAAVASLIVGAITVRLLGLNLVEARRVTDAALASAEAANESVEVTRAAAEQSAELSMAQVRAYISVVSARIEITLNSIDSKVIYTNTGQSPARIIRLEWKTEIFDCPYVARDEDDWRLAWEDTMGPSFKPDLPPTNSDSVDAYGSYGLGTDDLDSYVRLRITGEVRYWDVFHRQQLVPFAFHKVLRRAGNMDVALDRSPVPQGDSK